MNEEIILNVESYNPYVIGAVAYVEQLENGAKITIVDKNGTTTATVEDGKDGKSISSIVLNDNYTLTINYEDGSSTTTGSIRGATGASGVFYGEEEPIDPAINVWVDPADGDGSVLKIRDEDDQWTTIESIVGEPAGFGTVTATVDANHGTPAVTVTTSGDDTAKNFAFAFSNLQPAPYDDSELQADFATLQGQFDTAVAAVTTDTEVTDIRVGADGITDTTAGASVRRQFTDLKSALTKLANLNVYGIAPKIKGKIINSDGSYTSNTYADILIYRVPDNAVRVSAYNGITVGGVLYQSASLFAFCDKNDQLIQFVNGQSYPTGMVTLLIPDGTYYVKVVQSNQTDDKNNVFVGFDTEMRQILNSLIENYLDENVLKVGYYIDNTGTNILDGAHNFWYTDFIEVSKGCINYKGIGLSNVSVVSFYDSSQNWIGSTPGEGFDAYTKGSVVVPDNAKYVRYCSLKNGSYSTLDVTDMEFNFTAYSPPIDITPEFKNITWLAIGDSITYGDTVDGYAYPNYIEDSTDVVLSKEGHSGYSMGALYNIRNQFIASCDIATIFAGTNDFNANKTLGTINDSTTDTFYGVVNLMMQYMQSTYNNAPVIFFTPIWRNYNGSESGVIAGMVNNNGDNLKDFAEAIVACGKKHGVPVIDLCNDSGIGEYNITGLTSDGVHPNARGQKVLSGIFKSVLHKYADYLD